MIGRRNFLKGMAGILAASVAPAAIGSGILMPVRQIWTPSTTVVHPFPTFQARFMGWSITNTGPGALTLKGLYDRELYVDAGDVVIHPGEVISYDAETRGFTRSMVLR